MHLNGAKALAASKTLAKLTTLNLYGNNIRDTGAQALAASKTLTNLTSLDLGGNDIGPDAAKAFTFTFTFVPFIFTHPSCCQYCVGVDCEGVSEMALKAHSLTM